MSALNGEKTFDDFYCRSEKGPEKYFIRHVLRRGPNYRIFEDLEASRTGYTAGIEKIDLNFGRKHRHSLGGKRFSLAVVVEWSPICRLEIL